MKRVVFLLKRKVDKEIEEDYVSYLKDNGIEGQYIYLGNKDDVHSFANHFIDKETLPVTDSVEVYEALKKQEEDALVYLWDDSAMDEFAGAKFFVMNAEDADWDYYEKVYNRIHDIPWVMLETDRLILRETIEDDVDEFVKIYADPRMTEYMEGLYSLEEEKLYTREYREKVYATQGFGIWTVIRKSDNRIIGRAGVTYREGFSELEIGFAIGCEYQRQGYAKEAVNAVCSFAKENNLGELIALIRPGNIASEELVKGFGFNPDQSTFINGIEHRVWKQ